eukprot:COSAG03_NODE_2990_length_2305_cov_4.154125_2_plen_221_part_00
MVRGRQIARLAAWAWAAAMRADGAARRPILRRTALCDRVPPSWRSHTGGAPASSQLLGRLGFQPGSTGSSIVFGLLDLKTGHCGSRPDRPLLLELLSEERPNVYLKVRPPCPPFAHTHTHAPRRTPTRRCCVVLQAEDEGDDGYCILNMIAMRDIHMHAEILWSVSLQMYEEEEGKFSSDAYLRAKKECDRCAAAAEEEGAAASAAAAAEVGPRPNALRL